MAPQLKPYEFLSNRRCFSDVSPMGMPSKYPFGKLFANNGYAKAAELMPGASYLSKFRMSTSDSDGQQSGSGITELERAFGSGDKCNQLMNTVEASKSINATTADADDSYCDSSDVDCEELDEA